MDTKLSRRHLLQVIVTVIHEHLLAFIALSSAATLVPIASRLDVGQVLARLVQRSDLVPVDRLDMSALLGTTASLHAVSVLTGLTSFIRTAVVLFISTIHMMVRMTIDLAASILVPTKQALLLIFLPSLNPLNVLALAVDDVLAARVNGAEVCAFGVVVD